MWWLLSYLILSVNTLSEGHERRKRMNRRRSFSWIPTWSQRWATILQFGMVLNLGRSRMTVLQDMHYGWSLYYSEVLHLFINKPTCFRSKSSLYSRDLSSPLFTQMYLYYRQLGGSVDTFSHCYVWAPYLQLQNSLCCNSKLSSLTGCRQEQPRQWLEGLEDAPFKACMLCIISTLLS